jgi:hypothetical protein
MEFIRRSFGGRIDTDFSPLRHQGTKKSIAQEDTEDTEGIKNYELKIKKEKKPRMEFIRRSFGGRITRIIFCHKEAQKDFSATEDAEKRKTQLKMQSSFDKSTADAHANPKKFRRRKNKRSLSTLVLPNSIFIII